MKIVVSYRDRVDAAFGPEKSPSQREMHGDPITDDCHWSRYHSTFRKRVIFFIKEQINVFLETKVSRWGVGEGSFYGAETPSINM